MKKLVIIPGGFHPFHAGHKALYDQAREAFPSADIYMAATNDTSERPFPFQIKKKLAKLAGVPEHRFIQVKSPFSPREITDHYDPNTTQLIYVKSEKNSRTGPDPEGPFPAEIDPKTGKLPLVTRGARKGQPVSDWLQYYRRNGLAPMSQHGYVKYLPVREFSGMTSGSEIRAKWPNYNDSTKKQLVNLMYPMTVGNDKLTDIVVKLINNGLGASKSSTPEPTTNEAVLTVSDDSKHTIIPDGGMGTYDEETLVRALSRDFSELLQMVKNKNYAGAYQKAYDKWSPMQSRLKSLAQYDQFIDKRGQSLRPNTEHDMSQYSDYVEE